jgi:hypothetical protein
LDPRQPPFRHTQNVGLKQLFNPPRIADPAVIHAAHKKTAEQA